MENVQKYIKQQHSSCDSNKLDGYSSALVLQASRRTSNPHLWLLAVFCSVHCQDDSTLLQKCWAPYAEAVFPSMLILHNQQRRKCVQCQADRYVYRFSWLQKLGWYTGSQTRGVTHFIEPSQFTALTKRLTCRSLIMSVLLYFFKVLLSH